MATGVVVVVVAILLGWANIQYWNALSCKVDWIKRSKCCNNLLNAYICSPPYQTHTHTHLIWGEGHCPPFHASHTPPSLSPLWYLFFGENDLCWIHVIFHLLHVSRSDNHRCHSRLMEEPGNGHLAHSCIWREQNTGSHLKCCLLLLCAMPVGPTFKITHPPTQIQSNKGANTYDLE